MLARWRRAGRRRGRPIPKRRSDACLCCGKRTARDGCNPGLANRRASCSTKAWSQGSKPRPPRRRSPIAVNDGERRLTYAELNRAGQRARAAAASGSSIRSRRRRTPLVGLCLPRSVDLIVGILGILKAGAAYVPVDVDAPQARLRFILEDAGASLLVTQRGVLDAAPELIPPQLWVDDIAGRSRRRQSRPADFRADAAAYVIYTSGSTGEPKGVVVSHRNVLRLFTATRAVVRFGPRDVWSSVPFGRLRFLGLGDLGRAAARRTAGGRAVRGEPRPGAFPRPA